MEERESFIFYKSFYESLKDVPNEIKLQVYEAICEYSIYGKIRELTGISKALFTLILPQLDANAKRYENGKKGGRPKKENQTETETKPKQNQNKTEAKPNVNVNDNVNVNVNDNDIYIASEDKSSTATTAKASKHKYGRFKNVLLKDQELQSLEEEFDNVEELINFLDEYIEMKGYKAKSHYLAIKKWVVDAVSESKIRKEKANKVFKNNFEKREYKNLDNLFDNL